MFREWIQFVAQVIHKVGNGPCLHVHHHMCLHSWRGVPSFLHRVTILGLECHRYGYPAPPSSIPRSSPCSSCLFSAHPLKYTCIVCATGPVGNYTCEYQVCRTCELQVQGEISFAIDKSSCMVTTWIRYFHITWCSRLLRLREG